MLERVFDLEDNSELCGYIYNNSTFFCIACADRS